MANGAGQCFHSGPIRTSGLLVICDWAAFVGLCLATSTALTSMGSNKRDEEAATFQTRKTRRLWQSASGAERQWGDANKVEAQQASRPGYVDLK
jgi:hypothetical protein